MDHVFGPIDGPGSGQTFAIETLQLPLPRSEEKGVSMMDAIRAARTVPGTDISARFGSTFACRLYLFALVL